MVMARLAALRILRVTATSHESAQRVKHCIGNSFCIGSGGSGAGFRDIRKTRALRRAAYSGSEALGVLKSIEFINILLR